MRRRTYLRNLSLATMFLLLIAGSLRAQQAATEEAPKEEKAASKETASVKPKLVKLDDVREHMGEEVLVEFDVKNSKLLDNKKMCFLNSLKNYRDKKNFTVLIKSDTLELFAKSKVLDPAKHYLGKKIRVRGKVEDHKGKTQIVIKKFDQIRILATPAVKDDSAKEAKVAVAGEDTKTE